MATVAETLELADRCERAAGPNQYLEKAIAEAVGERNPHGVLIAAGYVGIGRFTGSIDAAARLVPESWNWAVGCGENRKGGHAYLRALDGENDIETDAATPALALCAAALRAAAAKARADG